MNPADAVVILIRTRASRSNLLKKRGNVNAVQKIQEKP
jgi:hypothetical protein